MANLGHAVHIVLRMAPFTRVHGRKVNVVDAHNEIIKKIGRVAFAKFGSSGTDERVSKLNAQIEEGIKTFLIIIGKQESDFVGFQGQLSSVYRGKLTAQIDQITPTYYGELDMTAGLWFILCTPLTRCNPKKFFLVTNERPLLDVVSECRTSSMLVTER
jgi:hypothetical protein